MSSPLFRAGMFLALAACFGSQAFALDPKKWSQINNESNLDYIFQISDWKTVVGNVYIKKAGEEGSMVKLSSAKELTHLKARTKYLAYFETKAVVGLALTVRFSTGTGDYTELNFKRGVATAGQGDRVVLSPRDLLSTSPLTLGLSGFRNIAGPPFITITNLGMATSDTPDE